MVVPQAGVTFGSSRKRVVLQLSTTTMINWIYQKRSNVCGFRPNSGDWYRWYKVIGRPKGFHVARSCMWTRQSALLWTQPRPHDSKRISWISWKITWNISMRFQDWRRRSLIWSTWDIKHLSTLDRYQLMSDSLRNSSSRPPELCSLFANRPSDLWSFSVDSVSGATLTTLISTSKVKKAEQILLTSSFQQTWETKPKQIRYPTLSSFLKVKLDKAMF